MKIGHTIHFFENIDSTNDYLDQLCSKTDPSHGLTIVAAYQSAGKGQFGRNWIADKDKNILMSILLKPDNLRVQEIARLHFFVTISIVQFIKNVISESKRIQIKWPNDILIDEKKVGGILIKNGLSTESVKSSIVGIGLNVFQQEFKKDFRLNATSLVLEGAVIKDKSELLNRLLDVLNNNYQLLNSDDILKQKYLESLYGYQIYKAYLELENQITFEAKLINVGYNGSVDLVMKDTEDIRHFLPGEIQLIFDNSNDKQ